MAMQLTPDEEELLVEARAEELNDLWHYHMNDHLLDKEVHVACDPETDGYQVMLLDEAARLMEDGQIINESYEENFTDE